MVLGAELEVVGKEGKRSVSIENFFTGPGSTVMSLSGTERRCQLSSPRALIKAIEMAEGSK